MQKETVKICIFSKNNFSRTFTGNRVDSHNILWPRKSRDLEVTTWNTGVINRILFLGGVFQICQNASKKFGKVANVCLAVVLEGEGHVPWKHCDFEDKTGVGNSPLQSRQKCFSQNVLNTNEFFFFFSTGLFFKNNMICIKGVTAT